MPDDMSQLLLEAKRANEEINTAFEEFKKTHTESLDEYQKKGSVDPLVTERLEKVEASIQANEAKNDELILAQKRAARTVTDGAGNAIDLDQKAHDWGKSFGAKDDMNAEKLDQYKSGLGVYLRKGDRALSVDEYKALSVGSDSAGGYVVDPDTSGRIVKKIFETSPIRAYASVQVIGTDELSGLYDDQEADAGWVSEAGSRSETTTPGLGEWRIPVHEIYAAPRATQRLLDDASFNAEQWLGEKVSSKMLRKENTAYTVGTGTGQPRGFMTYADGDSVRGEVKQYKTGASGAFKAAPDGGDVFMDALYALKGEYRQSANWFMNRSTMAATRKLKDSDGRYLWQPGIEAGQPSSLLGHAIAAAFEDMADIAAGSLSIAVGDLGAAYQIVDRQGLRVIRDLFTVKPYVEFYTTKRTGGGLINGEALKFIKFAA
jgi:HK97 family phage major capsid protein